MRRGAAPGDLGLGAGVQRRRRPRQEAYFSEKLPTASVWRVPKGSRGVGVEQAAIA